MSSHADLTLELLRLALVVGLLAVLWYKGRQHDLQTQAGWTWILVGLSVFVLAAGLDVVDSFYTFQADLPGGVGYESLTEDLVLPIAGLGALAYGLVRWIPLPARLQQTRDQLQDANQRLEQRVEERTEALSAAKERLEQLLEHTPAVIYTCQPEPPHEVTWLCSNTEHVLGVEADELLGVANTWMHRIHPQDRDGAERVLQRARTRPEEGTREQEYRMRINGGERWLLEYVRPITDDEGRVVELIASAIDITDRKEAQHEVEESQRRLSEIVEHLEASVWLATLEDDPSESEVLYLSPGAGEMVGMSQEELRSNPMVFLDRVHPEDRDGVLEAIIPDGSGGRSFETEYRIQLDDGSIRHVRTEGFPIQGPEGTPDRIAGISQDVTELRGAERELAESEALFRSIRDDVMDASGVGLFILDEDMQVAWVNEATEAFFGLERDEVLGRDKRDLIDEQISAILEDPESFRETVVSTYDDNTYAEDFLCHVLPGDGREGRWLQHSSRPIESGYYEGGRLEQYTDVTDRVEAQREADRERHRYEQILSTAPNCIVHIDADGEFTYANERAEEVLGLDPSEVTGRAYNDPEWEIRDLDGEPIPDEELPFRKVLDTGEVVIDDRHTITWPDGSQRILSVYGAPFFDDDGEVESTVFYLADVTEDLQRQRAIERERDLRAALFEENVDPILAFAFDEQGAPVIRDINASFSEVFGFDTEELVGHRLDEVIVPEEGRTEHEVIAQRVARGEPVDAEVVRMTAQGPLEFRLQVIPLGLEEAGIDGYAWYTDLSKIRKLEREEAFKAQLLDRVGQAVNAIDAEGTIQYWNEHAEELFGYSKEEAIGENIYELIGAHEEHVEEILDHMQRGEEWTGELTVQRPDGSEALAVFTKEPLFDEEGNLDGVIGISYDVTDLRQLEQEEALKARMLDQVGQAVFAMDEEAHVTYWNEYAEELFGHTAEQALGENAVELLVPPEARAQADEALETIGGGESWSSEMTLRRRDGSTFPALAAGSPILDEEGEMTGLIGICQDISEIKETQRELSALTNRLRSRNRELRGLSQAAAHGFRTPIWDTVRYLELLQRDAQEKLDDEEHEYLDTALDGAHRLHDLVESLQEYLDASTREPDPGPTDAGEVLDQVLVSIGDKLEAEGARVDIEEPVPELAVGSRSLAEVFEHLIDNALAFHGDEPPRIEISFEREDHMWVVSVADNGIGIEPQYQERIFRPFRTLHSHAEGGGSGLGLALCRGIVEAHGGTIWVTSTPGERSTFHMTLPAAGQGVVALAAEAEGAGVDEGVPEEGLEDASDLFE